MSNSTHQFKVKGVDATGKLFDTIGAKAKATGASIRAALGGALAAAGAYLSVRAIAGAVNELGKLSDLAQKANVSVDELTRGVTAMNVLGVNMSAESLAKSMQLLEKNTGKSGMSGFYEVIGEIGKIPSASERAKAAVAAFGRSGLEFMPLINGAKEGTEALQNVMAALPAVSQAAADAGDDIANGAQIVSSQFKTWWLEAVGKVAAFVSGQTPESFRQSMALIMAYADYYAHSIWDILQATWLRITRLGGALTALSNAVGAAIGATFVHVFGPGGQATRALYAFQEFAEKTWLHISRGSGTLISAANAVGAAVSLVFEKLFGSSRQSWGEIGDQIATAWRSGSQEFDDMIGDVERKYAEKRKRLSKTTWGDVGNSIAEAWSAGFKEYDDEIEAIERRMDERGKAFAPRIVAAETFEKNYRGAAKSSGGEMGEAFGRAAAKRITNALILGGSNEARKLAILGPQYQNEQRKTNEWLAKIAKNTEKTADNTEGGEDLAATDL